MAGKNFDISKFAATLKPVSESDHTGPEKIEYIDIGLLDGDERNFYQLTDIDELADNIQMCGLQQPIRVRAGEGGRFTIVSGHRRRAALAQLVDNGLDQFRRVPCIRETDDVSPALQELRLIFANSSTRKLTSAEIGEQAERVEALLYQLKEDGFEFPEGRMRDMVAAACNTHGSKLARIKVIRERLLSNLRPAWDGGKMPEQAAYALAQFPADTDMMENVTKFKAALAAVLAAMTALWGRFGWLVLAWVGCMAIDYITGYSAAAKNGEWSSQIAREGLWHKAGCIFAVLVAGILDAVVGYLLGNIHGLALPFEYTVFVCPLVVVWYMLMELGSILENVGKMGAPLPEFLKKMIVVLKATVDSAGDAASGDHEGSANS